MIQYRKMKTKKGNKMKNYRGLAVWLLAVLFMACAALESEMMKEARNIQNGLLKQKSDLDSVLNVEATNVEKTIAIMSEDSTMAKDTIKYKEFVSLMSKKELIESAKSKLEDWKINSKLLPTEEEQKNGVENPFGPEAKDLDILKSIKEAQSSFNDLRSQIESEIQ